MWKSWEKTLVSCDLHGRCKVGKSDPKIWSQMVGLKDGDFHPMRSQSVKKHHPRPSFVVSNLHLVEFVLPEAEFFGHWKNQPCFSNLGPCFFVGRTWRPDGIRNWACQAKKQLDSHWHLVILWASQTIDVRELCRLSKQEVTQNLPKSLILPTREIYISAPAEKMAPHPMVASKSLAHLHMFGPSRW